MEEGSQSVSRRGFVLGTVGALAAAGAAAPAAEAVPARAGASQVPFHPVYRRSRFAPHVNTVFRTKGSDGKAATLTLVDIADLRTGRAASGDELENSFRLVFRGTGAVRLGQGTYILRRSGFEPFALFLVPVGRRGGARFYEAVVHRFKP